MDSFDEELGEDIALIITDLTVRGPSKGVSRQAIKAALGDRVSPAEVNNCLKKAVAAGKLIQVKGSFKLAAAPVTSPSSALGQFRALLAEMLEAAAAGPDAARASLAKIAAFVADTETADIDEQLKRRLIRSIEEMSQTMCFGLGIGAEGVGPAGASLKGFVYRYPNLTAELNSLADRERDFCESMSDYGDPDADNETMVLKQLTLPESPGGDDLPFAADSTVNKFAHLVLKLLDACETGSIGGDAIRIGDVVNSAVCDVMNLGKDTVTWFEHGVGLVLALVNHGLHSWLQRGDSDIGQRDLARLGKMLEGVFKVPEAKMASLGISPELRKFGIDSCERLKQHFKQQALEEGNSFKFKYIVVPRASKADSAASVSNATPSASSGQACRAKRPLEFSPDQRASPTKPTKKAKKSKKSTSGAAAVSPIPEFSDFTHPAAAKVQAWIAALGDIRQPGVQKGQWQLRCTDGSPGRLRVLVVSGATTFALLNRTIAEAFGWGVGHFEHDANRGTAPALSGFIVTPPGDKDGRAIVATKRRADGIGGTKGMAFLSERAVQVCHVFRSRGDELTYKCGANTVSITLDGIDPQKTRIPLPRCVGADASLGSTKSMTMAGNWGWNRLNDRYRCDRNFGDSLLVNVSIIPPGSDEERAMWMNFLRRPLFDNTGAPFDHGWLRRTPLATALEAVVRPFAALPPGPKV